MKLLILILLNILLREINTQNCSKYCRKCDLNTNSCLFCDLEKNSIVEDQKCVLLQYPNCLTYWPNEQCMKCEDTHFLSNRQCSIRPESQTVENCEAYVEKSCSQCKENFQIIQGKCIAVEDTIKGCKIYTDDQKNSCQLCEDGYQLTRDQKLCLAIQESEHCAIYNYVQCKKCSQNYFQNKNLYLKTFFKFQDQEQRALFASFQYINKLQKINDCELIEVKNCKILKNNKTCEQCQDRYFLRNGQCIRFPEQRIENCIVYKLETDTPHCIKCSQGYYLQTNRICQQVTVIENCTEFDGSSSTVKCTKCISTFFLNDGICTPRNLNDQISNCKENQITSQKCQTCETGYRVTDDNLICLQIIENCRVYQLSNEATKDFTCEICNNGLTYNITTGKCENGTVDQCLEYRNNNTCYQCNHSYFYNKTCQKHEEIKFCKTYSRDTKNICDTCETQYLSLLMNTTCEIFIEIENCEIYRATNECQQCKDGYTPKNNLAEQNLTTVNSCVEIDKSLNCLQLQGSGNCVKCKTTTVSNGEGKCLNTIDFYIELCEKNNINGVVQFQNFICDQCVLEAVPYYSDSYYMCSSLENFSEIPQFCIKWSLNKITNSYYCTFCKLGYYLNEGNCFVDCSLNNKTIVLTKIEKKKALTTNEYTDYKISQSNVCLTDLNLQTENCNKVSIDIYFQNLNYNIITYVCVECKENYLSVIALKSTTNLISGNLDFELQGPLVTYPGLYCLTLSIDTVLSTFKQNMQVPNCEYYNNILRKSTLNAYGCLKCKFGYNGVVVESGSNLDYHGYIDKCESFNENLLAIEGKCDLNIKYQGYTNSFYDLNWNKVPLESYLSCFACQQVIGKNFKPFLFISFEDVEFKNENEQYDVIKNDFITRKNFETFTKYNPYYNEMTKNPFLGEFGIEAGKTPYKKQGGKNLMCLDNDPNTFFIDKDNYKILGSERQDWNKCALFIVNINRDFDASQSSIQDPLLEKSTIFCAACMPGYKASQSEKLKDSNLNLKYIPFYIYQCNKIENCKTENTWVNNCEKCNDGYAHRWNSTLKTIEYNICVQTQADFCEASSDLGQCIICIKGYSMVNNKCDKIIPPFCKTDETIVDFWYPVNLHYIEIGRNLLSIRQHTTGCNFCLEGQIAYEINIQQQNLTNLYHQYVCMKSGILENITDQNKLFVPNCNNYFIDSAKNYTCKICQQNFILTTQGKCIQQILLPNCIKADQNADSSYRCVECQSSYIFLSGKCVKGTIDKCIEYVNDINAITQKCTKCLENYYSETTECKLGELQNCKNYQERLICEECKDGYELIKIQNSTICLLRNESLRCEKYNYDQLQKGIIQCEKCSQGYFAKDISENTKSVCMIYDKIENCILYDASNNFLQSTFKCKQCNQDNYLHQDKTSCIKRILVDPNCQTFDINNDICLECKEGFYIGQNKYECIKNPNGIVGCEIYSEENVCTKCQVNHYQSENGLCVQLNDNELIENCQYYSSKTGCQQCTSLYYVLNEKCQKTSAQNCLSTDSGTSCKLCPEGYGFKMENFITNCVKKNISNCLISEDTDPFNCLQCESEYYIDKGKCLQQENAILNCIAYDSINTCQICKKGYFLNIDKKTCIENLLINTLRDENCEEYQIVSPTICAACNKGYYFKDGSCTKCEDVKIEDGCDYCNPEQLSQCLLCSTDYYQDVLGKCKKLEATPTPSDDKDNEVVEPTKNLKILEILKLILILFL